MSTDLCTHIDVNGRACRRATLKNGVCGYHGGAECRCRAITKKGIRCQKASVEGGVLCLVHQTHGTTHGRATTPARPPPPPAEFEVETGEDKIVKGKLRQQMNVNVHHFAGDVNVNAVSRPKGLRVLVNGKVCRKFT